VGDAEPYGHEARAPQPAARGRQAEVTDLVLDAAERLFAENGVRSTSVRDIAAAAGVSHPLVHAYLGTKEAILAGLFARHGELSRRHAAELGDTRDLAAQLARYALGERRQYARLTLRAALEGEPFAIASDTFPGTLALADYAEQRMTADTGGRWYPGVSPRVLVASLVALCLGWAAASEGLLAAAGLEALPSEHADDMAVGVLVGTFRAAMPWDGAIPPFPGTHMEPPPVEPAPVAVAAAKGPARGVDRKGGRAQVTERIIRAAEGLYGGGGHDPSVREVAAAAGVSHALVHRYTGSKQELEATVLSRNEQRLTAAARNAGTVQQAMVTLLREDLRRGRPYLRLGAAAALDTDHGPRPEGYPATRYLVGVAREQAAAAGAPAAFPGVDPGFAVAGAMAMALGWVVLGTWLPQIVGLDVPDASAFDEQFLAVVDCDLTAHIAE
jgi:AcrR family transcriptional regulator